MFDNITEETIEASIEKSKKLVDSFDVDSLSPNELFNLIIAVSMAVPLLVKRLALQMGMFTPTRIMSIYAIINQLMFKYTLQSLTPEEKELGDRQTAELERGQKRQYM